MFDRGRDGVEYCPSLSELRRDWWLEGQNMESENQSGQLVLFAGSESLVTEVTEYYEG